MKIKILSLTLFSLIFASGCNTYNPSSKNKNDKLSVIFDTDANNELDDQHALAYLLLNGETFDVKAVTINATYNGGDVTEHYKEADRIMKLCKAPTTTPLIIGANKSFESIIPNLSNPEFDGYDAVNFIITEAKKHKKEKLIILAVGKLTNVALAVKKSPEITSNIRLVWLGSNYPESGEYNLENDIPAMNFLLETDITFEMAVCRYGKKTGTDWVKVTKEDILTRMPNLGPQTTDYVLGRHNGEFYNFGDYSVSLFENCHYYGTPPSRSLFDMAAVAIVKNPNWAKNKLIAGPTMIDKLWIDHPGNERKITIWENFDKDSILIDFYNTMENFVIIK